MRVIEAFENLISNSSEGVVPRASLGDTPVKKLKRRWCNHLGTEPWVLCHGHTFGTKASITLDSDSGF